MPSFSSTFSRAFRLVDLFPSSKLVRYNGQTEYTSTTGGIVSVAVIVVFVILFSSMGIRTVRKQIIETSTQFFKESNPSQLKMMMSQDGGFMFAFLINGFNLTSVPKLFDLTLLQQTYSAGYVHVNTTQIPLVQCTEQHFAYSEELRIRYHRTGLSSALCPQLGSQLTVQGSASDDIYKILRLNINRCNSTIDPTCVNDSTFAGIEATVGRFAIAVVTLQMNLNPSSQQYKEPFISDQHFFTFNSQLGANAFLNIRNDQIQTDLSLMPFKQMQNENITHMPEKIIVMPYITTPGQNYAVINFMKSNSAVIHKRSFNKVDTYFSYVGGLIGTIIGLIFIMGPYTQKTYEISLAKKVMLDNDKQEVQSSSFNIIYFLLSYIKQFLNYLNCHPDWPSVQKYIEASDEAIAQIDMIYIVRKLMFLDAAFSKIMEKYQIDAICMREKPTFDKAKELRKMHFAPELFKEEQEEKNQAPLEQEIINTKRVKFDENIQRSPTNIRLLRRTSVGKNEENFGKGDEDGEDVSDIQFSRRNVDMENIKATLSQLERDGKSGKVRSRRIMDELHPGMLRSLNQSEKKRQEDHVVELANISDSQDPSEKVAPADAEDFDNRSL